MTALLLMRLWKGNTLLFSFYIHFSFHFIYFTQHYRTMFNLDKYNTKIVLQTLIESLPIYISLLQWKIEYTLRFTNWKNRHCNKLKIKYFYIDEWQVQIDQIINSYSWLYK